MLRALQSFNTWLEATFVGPHGYTVYADGRMHRGQSQIGETTPVNLGSFRKVFGESAELDGAHFFVPSNPGTHSGLVGSFGLTDDQLTATAEFVWNRAGLKASMFWVWFCLLSAGLDILSGGIALAQGTLTVGDMTVISLTLLSLVLLMYLPRVIAELKEKLLHGSRQPTIAKLSALVQHEGQS